MIEFLAKGIPSAPTIVGEVPDHPALYWQRVYPSRYWDISDTCIITFFVEKWYIERATPKGFWLRRNKQKWNKKKFVLRNSRRKYAYPTADEAWNSLCIRTNYRIHHCKNNLKAAEATKAALEKLGRTQQWIT